MGGDSEGRVLRRVEGEGEQRRSSVRGGVRGLAEWDKADNRNMEEQACWKAGGRCRVES